MTFPAVLWDMDGTLVDTEPQWLAGERALAAAHNAVWTEEDSLALVGSDLRRAARYIRDRTGSADSIEAIIDQLGERVAGSLREHIDWRPGARELFKEFEQRGIPQALVTMSYRYIAQPVIDQLNFDAIVTGDIVQQGKPHPEPYLMAARLLDVDPQECLAIEDSTTGTASAAAAGCWVVAVPHAVQVPPAARQLVIPSLASVTFEQLSRDVRAR